MHTVKVMLAIARKKENDYKTGKEERIKTFKRIFSNDKERKQALIQLKALTKVYPKQKWRIYETVNDRDLRKAWFLFQDKILKWQEQDKNGKMEWLQHIKSEWISCLMRPESCVSDRKFIIDLDSRRAEDKKLLTELLKIWKIKVHERYNTPNGMHVITEPFMSCISFHELGEKIEILRDGLRVVE